MASNGGRSVSFEISPQWRCMCMPTDFPLEVNMTSHPRVLPGGHGLVGQEEAFGIAYSQNVHSGASNMRKFT